MTARLGSRPAAAGGERCDVRRRARAPRVVVVALAPAVALVSALALAVPAGGQDFDAPSPAVAQGPGDLLERGLPAIGPRLALDALTVRYPLDLATRALIGAAGWRACRVGLGIARTGEQALGWSAAGAALGLATPRAGAALRGVVRRDEAPGPDEPGAGAEAGLGAWIASGPWRVWASAPQVWTGGLAPPLARGLETGVELDAPGVTVALARESPRRGFDEPAAWSGRAGLSFPAVDAWAGFREQPWRGSVGLAARVRALRVAAEVDAHPVLAPTARLAAGVAFGRAAR